MSELYRSLLRMNPAAGDTVSGRIMGIPKALYDEMRIERGLPALPNAAEDRAKAVRAMASAEQIQNAPAPYFFATGVCAIFGFPYARIPGHPQLSNHRYIFQNGCFYYPSRGVDFVADHSRDKDVLDNTQKTLRLAETGRDLSFIAHLRHGVRTRQLRTELREGKTKGCSIKFFVDQSHQEMYAGETVTVCTRALLEHISASQDPACNETWLSINEKETKPSAR